ncbi:MAG: 2Fe-2S iron-sulfur cluster binding domain-containing protein, partial [Chloroflexi bacterium]|nr:2Fe-2S iron-sulfur cluster binding domain-containing protein [Chloroflexota bacterium]
MAKDLVNKKSKVHFEPDNVDIAVEPGANLLETAIQAGARIYASCGGAGTCGTCKVLIEKGEVATTRTAKVSAEEFRQGLRQACQSRIVTDLAVHIPVESRLETAVIDRERKGITTTNQQIEALATGWKFHPPLSKFFIKLPPPTVQDNVSDLSRVLRGLKQQYKLR